MKQSEGGFLSSSLSLVSLSWSRQCLLHGQLPSAAILRSRKPDLIKLNSFAQWAKETGRMVPETAECFEHFEQEDMVALALLMGGFKLLPVYMHVFIYIYIYR